MDNLGLIPGQNGVPLKYEFQEDENPDPIYTENSLQNMRKWLYYIRCELYPKVIFPPY